MSKEYWKKAPLCLNLNLAAIMMFEMYLFMYQVSWTKEKSSRKTKKYGKKLGKGIKNSNGSFGSRKTSVFKENEIKAIISSKNERRTSLN